MDTSGLLQPDFPPLLKGVPLGPKVDPMAAAITDAQEDATPGLVHYAQTHDSLRAAITFTPEQPLSQAVAAIWAVQLGFADALGALAPPEIAVQFGWPDVLHVNGARCGGFRAAASTLDPQAEPDWLVIALDVALLLAGDGGDTPDHTALAEEGCAELTPPQLLESWSRHTLVWIHSYLHEGLAPLHAAYHGKVLGLGHDITLPAPGLFTGLDEKGGMILRRDDTTQILPLTQMLETR